MVKDDMTKAADQEFWLGVRLSLARGLVLGIGLLGLFTARDADAGATYGAGLVLFGFSTALLYCEIDRCFNGAESLFVRVDGLLASSSDALWVMLPGRILLAVGGLFLAARADDGAGYAMGLGVAGVSLVMAFLDLKSVFDRAER